MLLDFIYFLILNLFLGVVIHRQDYCEKKKKKESGVNGVSSTLNKSSIRIVGILQPNFYDKQNGMPWVFGRIAREHGP